jgi:hypothetical protein
MGTRTVLTRAAAGLVLAAAPGAAAAAPQPPGPPVPPPVASSRWGIIYRNTIGGPNAVLRGGPYDRSVLNSGAADIPPPYGVGSLGIIVGSANEKIDFGDETDFAGMPLSAVNVLKYWIYAGGDTLAGVTMPIISIEANPRLGASTFTSLNYVPDFSVPPSAPATRLPNTWQQYIASAAGSGWFATGATGTATGCTQITRCSFTVLKSRLPNAVISLSLGISKGRDTPFAGAVDGLQVNDTVYDFEPSGVRVRPVPPKP